MPRWPPPPTREGDTCSGHLQSERDKPTYMRHENGTQESPFWSVHTQYNPNPITINGHRDPHLFYMNFGNSSYKCGIIEYREKNSSRTIL